ncbi:hypothetical protein BT96DRAFT_830746 [Gymnopus androsaceus JB14]|uniref:Uncharacterized protein n=1 Tax=Gymnopus androsaceus JB14 TaxID=1447944 RepID=A0A6A4H505_9AGAR|nr:hypothetical protein BT96DRAFT_830746 [Gymnopus androsaceus JB14]
MWSSSLGYRPKGYQFSMIDYHSYRAALEDLLCSPWGRAAMLKGGIVAHLAEDFLTVEDVGHGPSDDVLQFGHCQKSSENPSLGYWDDELTSEELDLISGVYRVDSGKRQIGLNGPQTLDISWWPKHLAWAHSGLNIGTWNADCEHWYKGRLAAIQAGTAKLLSPTEWKSAIRFTHQSLKVAEIGEKLAAEFLDSII